MKNHFLCNVFWWGGIYLKCMNFIGQWQLEKDKEFIVSDMQQKTETPEVKQIQKEEMIGSGKWLYSLHEGSSQTMLTVMENIA